MTPPALPNPTLYAVPGFILFVFLELLIRWRGGQVRYQTKDMLASLSMGAGNLAESLLFGSIKFGVLLWAHQFAFFDVGWSVSAFVVAFIADDLRYYWWHRVAHESRWFWAGHVAHHSSQHYNLSTALRQSWTSTFSLGFMFSIPLAVLGFHPVMLAFVSSLNLIYQFWIHTEAIRTFPAPIEWIFNTPSHHRVHHARNARYLDANYAGTLIIWDRMFGTFVPEDPAERCEYGLVKNIGTFNPVRIAFHETIEMLKDATQRGISFGERLGYLWRPPGWRHDGSGKTSQTIKAEWVARHPDQAGQPGLPPGSTAASHQALR